MTEEETRAKKGAILLEISETDQQIEQWRDEARQIGNELGNIANQLIREPEKLVFSGETTDLRFANKELRNALAVDMPRVLRIRDNIRNLMLRRFDLEKSKSSYGL